MKAIARQCADAERAELDALLARQPELRAEFERLQAEVRVAKEALPLVNATEATSGEFPAYARGRLQTKVRQTLGRPPADEAALREREASLLWRWRWVLGLAVATASVALVILPLLRGTPQPVIQLALLDVGGPTRGGTTNELALLQQSWPSAGVATFDDAAALRNWEAAWPAAGGKVVAKIVYDRAAAELRVRGRSEQGRFERTFPVEPDVASTLARAPALVAEQLRD